MMNTAVSTIPPFERFYEEHRDEVFGYLVRLVGRDAAEDAFQETFLRALRGYPRLAHGRHLRAWAYDRDPGRDRRAPPTEADSGRPSSPRRRTAPRLRGARASHR